MKWWISNDDRDPLETPGMPIPDPDDLTTWTDEQLRASAGGCTELSCIYHGQINMERQRRKVR